MKPIEGYVIKYGMNYYSGICVNILSDISPMKRVTSFFFFIFIFYLIILFYVFSGLYIQHG